VTGPLRLIPIGYGRSSANPAIWIADTRRKHHMRRRSFALVAASLVALSGGGVAGAAGTHVKYDVGEYSATTSQGGSFKFKIEVHSAADHCGTSVSSHCFIALSYPTFTEPCPGGQPIGGSFSVPNGFVSAAGNFSYHQPLNGASEPLIQFQAHAVGARVTGTFREEDQSVGGSTTTLCDTGIVHWTARRV
jgi:hypothetical protein